MSVQLVDVERSAVPAAERAVERRGAIVGGQHVDQTGAVRASGLLRQPGEEAEDLVATRERARHDAVARDDPCRVLREQPAEREALLAGEGDDPSDELGVLSAWDGPSPTAR